VNVKLLVHFLEPFFSREKLAFLSLLEVGEAVFDLLHQHGRRQYGMSEDAHAGRGEGRMRWFIGWWYEFPLMCKRINRP
jgi:hypothetical protein